MPPESNILRGRGAWPSGEAAGGLVGVNIITAPDVTRIEVTNSVRTPAIVPVVNFYSGCDVLLERCNGVWTVTSSADAWIT